MRAAGETPRSEQAAPHWMISALQRVRCLFARREVGSGDTCTAEAAQTVSVPDEYEAGIVPVASATLETEMVALLEAKEEFPTPAITAAIDEVAGSVWVLSRPPENADDARKMIGVSRIHRAMLRHLKISPSLEVVRDGMEVTYKWSVGEKVVFEQRLEVGKQLPFTTAHKDSTIEARLVAKQGRVFIHTDHFPSRGDLAARKVAYVTFKWFHLSEDGSELLVDELTHLESLAKRRDPGAATAIVTRSVFRRKELSDK